jgi:hypothetical protein
MKTTPSAPAGLDEQLTAKAVLDQMRNSGLSDAEFNGWLLRLHEHYTDRMLADNSRIWQISAVFVPVALAAFAPLVAIKGLVHWSHVLVLGMPSTALLWLWLVIAENHRAFQQKSESWLFAIEEARGFFSRHAPNKYPKRPYEKLVTFPRAVQKARWLLVIGVTLFWLALWVFAAAGKLPGLSSV